MEEEWVVYVFVLFWCVDRLGNGVCVQGVSEKERNEKAIKVLKTRDDKAIGERRCESFPFNLIASFSISIYFVSSRSQSKHNHLPSPSHFPSKMSFPPTPSCSSFPSSTPNRKSQNANRLPNPRSSTSPPHTDTGLVKTGPSLTNV